MRIKSFALRLKLSFINRFLSPAIAQTRILKYKALSTGTAVSGRPVAIGPVLIKGSGAIVFESNVTIGVLASPNFYNTYCYIEARFPYSAIHFGAGVFINNNACFISEGEGIEVGKDVLIGPNFSALDSDFHNIHPAKRLHGTPKTGKVIIEENVFVGANVVVLKGVTIGMNSVIASNSVVTKSIPANVIAGGNPCKVLKHLTI